MLLGFKRRFAPMVEDGSKTHTIRAKRKGKQWRPGMMCDCFVDSRQKTMRLLGRWMCTKVEDALIYERGDGSFGVIVGEHELDNAEKNTFAWRDGFRSNGVDGAFEEMIAYWKEEHGNGNNALDFAGDLIHWRFDHADA
jgi:hypothetical protein